MKPIRKRGELVSSTSKLWEHRWPGAESVPAGAWGRIVDFKAQYWDLLPISMLAQVSFTVDARDPNGFVYTKQVKVWVNERALQLIGPPLHLPWCTA